MSWNRQISQEKTIAKIMLVAAGIAVLGTVVTCLQIIYSVRSPIIPEIRNL